ncbi:MAG TPA: hypothetical protein VLL54_17315 [Pyrinomonadaceae bacterium]|nr:hypothetical protein [Pyrinomonadaceae bacterium]
MKKAILFILGAILFISAEVSVVGQKFRKPMSPMRLVSDLYAHQKKGNPFFQRKSRALVDRYFDKSLGDLIWKDAKRSGDEVGALDGDPLFNAQDMKIKRLIVHSGVLSYEGPVKNDKTPPNHATVDVDFYNFREIHKITFELVRTRVGWRIHDIHYDDGSQLSTILKG